MSGPAIGEITHLTIFAAIWLRAWKAAGGYIGGIGDRDGAMKPALWMAEPCNDALVAALNGMADVMPGARQAIRDRVAATIFIPVHE